MSQFIEMFENVESYCKLEDLISDTFPGEWGSEPISENAIKVIRTTNFTNEGYLDLTDVVTRDIEPKKVVRKKLKQGDTILERSGGTKDNPVGRVVFFDEIGDYLPNNFTQVLRPKESVNPVYLFYALYNSYNLNKAAMRAMASQTTGIQNLSMSDFMAKSIVLPSRDEQNKFEQIYRQADKSKFDDFKSQFIEMFKDLPVNGTISDLTEGTPTSVKKTYGYEDLIEYIDISSIDSTSKTVLETSKHFVAKAPSRAQQCVKNGDILVSTVRPVNRNIAVIDNDIHNLVASTGFCILRPKEGYRDYLLSIVTSDLYTEKMCDKASGGLYPAVNNSDVLNYGIHIPDEGLANRVSIIYKQADKSKSVIQKALVYLNDIQSDELGKIA